MNISLDDVLDSLGKSESHPLIQAIISTYNVTIKKSAHYGSISVPSAGIGVTFKSAEWLFSPDQLTDPKELRVCSFQFFMEGYQGNRGYPGNLPENLTPTVNIESVRNLLGEPSKTGGGKFNPMTKEIALRWVSYHRKNHTLSLRFDDKGELCMVSTNLENRPLAKP